MVENYYYGKIVYCTKSGSDIILGENGEKYVAFSMPRLNVIGYSICKMDGNEYIDVRNNRRYTKLKHYEDAKKNNFYIMNIKSVKKLMEELSLKEKLQILKTIILIENTARLGKITTNEKEKTYSLLTRKVRE